MVTINQLVGAQGDARSLLALPETGVVMWSDTAELARLEVIRGIDFNGFTISRAEIGLNFVESSFRQCSFINVKADNHFWGAMDRWSECTFERCQLFGMIAPMNSFRRCRFETVTIENFRPHQTLFDGCSFTHTTIVGLRAELVSNRQIVNPEAGGGQLVFRDCSFREVSFRQCYFEGVVFQRCTFENTEASSCSFEGVVSDVIWWGEQKSDPFTLFLTKALDLIRKKCGRDSAAYREFESYMIDYVTGRTTSKDFSACLYNNRVPYAETKKVIKDLQELVDSFPF